MSVALFTTLSKTIPTLRRGARPILRASNRSRCSNASRRKRQHRKNNVASASCRWDTGWKPVPLLRLESRRFLLFPGPYIRAPAEFLQKRIRFPFYSIRDDFAQDRRELESMPAIAARDN